MIRKFLFSAMMACIVVTSFWPQQADAHGGFITLFCWGGTPSSGPGSAPSPTVGCSFAWSPGGTAHFATFLGRFPGCTPNCVITPNLGAWQEIQFLINPPSGAITVQVGGNCTGVIINVTVVSVATSTSQAAGKGEPIIVQQLDRTFAGPVGIYCP